MDNLLLFNWITYLPLIRELLLSVLLILIIIALAKYIKKM